MMRVRNNSDYRVGYELLHIYEDFLKAGSSNNPEACHERVDALKRELRQWAHRGNVSDVGMGFMVERRIVKDYGIDGYVELLSIPEVFDTEEDAADFFEHFIWIESPNSPYDCTGRAFTNWYKLVRRRGQFWAYHSVGFDV